MISTSPATFSMTLGTARDMVAAPANYRPEKVAEARRVVAYWRARAAKRARAQRVTACTGVQS